VSLSAKLTSRKPTFKSALQSLHQERQLTSSLEGKFSSKDPLLTLRFICTPLRASRKASSGRLSVSCRALVIYPSHIWFLSSRSITIIFYFNAGADACTKGSFLDGIILRNASFIVASKDDPTLGTLLPKPYPVHKGTLDRSQPMASNTLMLVIQVSRSALSSANFRPSIHLREVQLLVYFLALGGPVQLDSSSMCYCPLLRLSTLDKESPLIPSSFRFKQNLRCFNWKLVLKCQFQNKASRWIL
jgi:hypothetical protein